jgi:hypothetical protein
MELKDLLNKDFGVKLPISGGFGNSMENSIIIHKVDRNDQVEIEHLVLKCLGNGRGIEWEILKVETCSYGERKIDKIKIKTKQLTDSDIITQIENFYFDITEFFWHEEADKFFDEEQTLAKIKNRIVELENMNEFNKKCIGLLRAGEFFEDSKIDLVMKFLDVILKDESIVLFESMMDNKKKPILVVLEIIGKELNEI